MTQAAVNEPQQTRSARTMEKIVTATEALLAEKDWSEVTIQEIVDRADCSVGAFYGRFRDREGLLHALDERFFDELIALIETTASSSTWETTSLAETITAIAGLVVDLHRHKQGVMRTLILQARLQDDARFREREAQVMQSLPGVTSLILAHRDEIQHKDPEAAVLFGFLQLFFSAREMLIWPHIAPDVPFQGEALVTALARSYLSYLTNTVEG